MIRRVKVSALIAKREKQKRGFTMIELLAVLVILGIIMVIAVPSVVGYLQDSKQKYYEQLEDSVMTAGKEYFSDHRSLLPRENGQIYSVDIADLVTDGYTSDVLDSDGNGTCTGEVYVKRLATADFEYNACISCGQVDTAGKREYESTSAFCTNGSTGGIPGWVCDKPKEDPTDDCFMIQIPSSFKVPQCTTVEESAASQGIFLDGVVLNNGEDIGDRVTADTTSVDYKNIGNYKVYYTYKQVLKPSGEKYNFSVNVYDDKAPSDVTITMHTDSTTGEEYSCTTRENCNWTGKDVYITFTANDLSDCGTEGSGVARFMYRYGTNGDWTSVDATRITQADGFDIYQATIVRDTTYDGPIQVKAVDKASSSGASSNLESAVSQAYLLVDQTAPSCVSSGGNPAWINQGTRILTGTCSDANSGCAGDASKEYSADIDSTTESPGTVYDNVGNSTVCPGDQTVRIDKTKPTVSLSVTSQDSRYHTTTANVTVGQSDNLSGVTQMCILLNDNNVSNCSWQNYTNAAQARSTNRGYDGGSVTYYAWTKDAAGNVSDAGSASYTVYRQCSTTYTDWGGWGSCSTNCGNGSQSRSGTKIDSYLKINCGSDSQSQGCSDNSGCPPPSGGGGGSDGGNCCWVDWNNPHGSHGSCVKDICTTWANGVTSQCGSGCSGSHHGWGDEQCVWFNCS